MTLAPSGPGTVVLNIGAGIGALLVHVPAALRGHDVEVSPAGDPTIRTHAPVQARYVRGGIRWSVVLDSLPAGKYAVWRDPVTVLDEVEISEGEVAEYIWPVLAAAA